MSHRGPDDVGEWWSADGRVGFGHRRLSIIDLSAAGHQPMSDGTLTIVLNGEIYNYRALRAELARRGHGFRTQSDTEVALAAYREWDVDCLEHLSGMFALAIHDRSRDRVLLARDRAGEKPLFYSLDAEALRFASELKGLMADASLDRRLDREAMDCYLAMGFVPGDRSILAGVRKLPPAHAMSFEIGTGACKVWRYWSLPAMASEIAETTARDFVLLDELEVLVEGAVRAQLVADVPVGVLLSGGVDSSLVTAMAVRSASNCRTFTVRFPGFGRQDETEHARLIARHFGTTHLELDVTAPDPSLLPVLARQFDEPLVDSSMVPTYLLSRLVREHCTVALGGDGGDELFGGYAHYPRLLWLERRAAAVPASFRAPLALVAERVLPVGFRGRNWLQALSADFARELPLIAGYFDRRTRLRLMGHAGWQTKAETIRRQRLASGGDLLQRATRTDFENYLAEDILVKVDRASMLNSLEMRAPLLDQRLVEFAFAKVPSRLKATAEGGKLLLKRLAERVLPPQFDRTRKQGFEIPLASWLRAGPWQEFFQDVLLGSSSGIFGRSEVERILDGHIRGRSNSERLFALVMFELWYREYRVAL